MTGKLKEHGQKSNKNTVKSYDSRILSKMLKELSSI
jgi:hypothetical protein